MDCSVSSPSSSSSLFSSALVGCSFVAGMELGKAANIFAYTLTILSAFKASEVFIKLKVLLVVSSKRYAQSLLLCVGIYPVRITPTHQIDRKWVNERQQIPSHFLRYFVFPFAKAINKTENSLLAKRWHNTLSSNPICMELHFSVLNWIMLFDDDDDDALPFNRKTNQLHCTLCSLYEYERANEWKRMNVVEWRASGIHKFYLINTVIVVSWH